MGGSTRIILIPREKILKENCVMRQVMCGCVYTCIILVGMYKNHCLVVLYWLARVLASYHACTSSV